MNRVAIIIVVLIVAKWAAQWWLESLNRRHVRAHAGAVPEAFKGIVDEGTYEKSVRYTLARSRHHLIEISYHAAVLALVLFSGLLPWLFQWTSALLGHSAWASAGGRRRAPDAPMILVPRSYVQTRIKG